MIIHLKKCLLCLIAFFLMLSPSFAKEVTLSWAASTGATGYRIYCQEDSPSPPFPLCGDTGNTNTTHTVRNLDNGKLYSFAVTAYNSFGESAYSNIVTERAVIAGSGTSNTNKNTATNTTNTINTTDTSPNSSSAFSRIFAGQVEVNHAWKKVTLSRSFADPIVIVGPPSYRDAAPGLIQLRNIQSNSFEIRFREWTYLDGAHGNEQVSYLVMEEGRHAMADGAIWEVGSFYLGSSGTLSRQVFTRAFASTPALLLTAQTSDDVSKPVTVRARNLTRTGFRAGLYTQESLLGNHGQEKVGYVAVWNPKSSGTVASGVGNLSYTMSNLWVGGDFVQAGEFALRLQEEQSKDAEVKHVAERVNVLRIGSTLFAQPVTMNEADTVVCRYFEGIWTVGKSSSFRRRYFKKY